MPIASDRAGRRLSVAVLLAGLPLAAAFTVAEASPRPEGTQPESRAVGSLVVLGEPEGRPVWVNGRYRGVIPLRLDSLAAGGVLLEVGGVPGSRVWEPAFQLRARARPGVVDTVRAGRPSREPSFDSVAGGRPSAWTDLRRNPAPSRWPATLPVAAIVLGAAGVWSRHAADNAYDDYRRTLDRAAMDRHLDRARRLDRAAVACWVGAETCLVAAAWMLLRAAPDPPAGVTRDEHAFRLGVNLPAVLGAGSGRGAESGAPGGQAAP